MKIHEYQAKQILAKFGVTVPRGETITKPTEARGVAERLGGGTVVVKAQIHAGGRGKGGGVKLAKNPAEAEILAGRILGMTLITHQTGPEGRLVKRVLIEEGLDIARELYLGIVIDRATGKPVFMASSEGGVEIEVVAAKHPEKILKEFIDPSVGFQAYQARKLAFGLGLEGKVVNEAVRLLQSLYRAFEATDASLVEINPFITTRDGRALALDAKMTFDDNALYRHPEIKDLRDLDEEDPLEVKASNYGLNYIRLDGNVGCMVNGAGLAMATMDIIQYAGSRPANFLDVGGGANEEQVRRGFEIILSDANVRAVLINIFGGIMRCTTIASAILEAYKSVGFNVPLVVRLEGTEVEASRYDLSYIKLDGSIGCMVNGAGLAMATMDIIKLYGGEPANFLDVGGGASKEKVTAAFKLILSDKHVEGILVNIFGGIMKCDIIAEGIVAAAKEVHLDKPLVVRLEGTNVEKGKDILAHSGLPIVSGNDLADAAQKIVKAVKGGN